MTHHEALKEAIYRAGLNGIKLRDIEYKSGYSRQTINNWCQQKYTPVVQNLVDVVNACGFDIDFKITKKVV